MGNTQSAEHHHSHHHHHHQHNRLSKPKTHSTVLLSVAPKPGTSTAAASQSNVCLSAKDHPQISSQLPSPVVTDFGCHSHGNDGVGPPAGPPSHRRQSSTSRANSLSCFGSSKSNDTTKLTSLPGSKISLVSNGQVVDLKTAIQIVQDAKQNASPADLAALGMCLIKPKQSSLVTCLLPRFYRERVPQCFHFPLPLLTAIGSSSQSSTKFDHPQLDLVHHQASLPLCNAWCSHAQRPGRRIPAHVALLEGT